MVERNETVHSSGEVFAATACRSRAWSRVQGLGSTVQGLGFRVRGSGFRVWGQGSGFRVQGSGFRVQGLGFRVQGLGFRVQGSGFRVQGFRFRISGIGSMFRKRREDKERGGKVASEPRDLVEAVCELEGKLRGHVGCDPVAEAVARLECERRYLLLVGFVV